jgi:ubiquitin C-terminal hydrolase
VPMKQLWNKSNARSGDNITPGIDNQGATCYLNSVLQVLHQITPFVEYLWNPLFDEIPDTSTPKKSIIVQSRNMMLSLGTGKGSVDSKAFTKALKNLPGGSNEPFHGGRQCDGGEFLNLLLGQIGEVQRQSRGIPPLSDIFGIRRDIKYTDTLNPLQNFFVKSEIDLIQVIRVDLADGSLENGVDNSQQATLMENDGNTPRINEGWSVRVTTRTEFTPTGGHRIFEIDRGVPGEAKDRRRMTFPLRGLVLGGKSWSLVGVTAHVGACGAYGHFVSIHWNADFGAWIAANDDIVKLAESRDVEQLYGDGKLDTPVATCLVYKLDYNL